MSWWESVSNFVTFGARDRAKSERLISAAQDGVEEARERLEESRQETQRTLEHLGELRASVYSGTLTRFRQSLQQVANARAGDPLKCVGGDVPPPLSSTAVWSPIPHPKEIGREEALFRRADHRLPA